MITPFGIATFYTLHGVVEERDGKPVPNANVMALDKDGNVLESNGKRLGVKTKEDGTFKIIIPAFMVGTNIVPVTKMVKVRADNLPEATFDFTTTRIKDGVREFTLFNRPDQEEDAVYVNWEKGKKNNKWWIIGIIGLVVLGIIMAIVFTSASRES